MSPIWFVVIWVINKIQPLHRGIPICWSQIWLQIELDYTKSCYQSIKTMTKSEKETRHHLYVFIKKNDRQLNKMCTDSACRWWVHCPLSQTWYVNCPIKLSNYKHDAYTVLLVLKSGWWWPITFENLLWFWLIMLLALSWSWW